jgi:hypothetical protein
MAPTFKVLGVVLAAVVGEEVEEVSGLELEEQATKPKLSNNRLMNERLFID